MIRLVLESACSLSITLREISTKSFLEKHLLLCDEKTTLIVCYNMLLLACCYNIIWGGGGTAIIYLFYPYISCSLQERGKQHVTHSSNGCIYSYIQLQLSDVVVTISRWSEFTIFKDTGSWLNLKNIIIMWSSLQERGKQHGTNNVVSIKFHNKLWAAKDCQMTF